MDRNKWWLVGAVLVIGLALLTGWSLGISPQLRSAQDTRTEQVSIDAQNVSSEALLASLQEQFDGLDDLENELAKLRKSIPNAAELPEFFRQIDAVAAEQQVSVASITAADAQPVIILDAPAADDAAATTPTTVLSPEQFVTVPVTITVEGGYDSALAFVHGLQLGERVLTITNISTQPLAGEETSEAVTATISGLVYVLLDASSQ